MSQNLTHLSGKKAAKNGGCGRPAGRGVLVGGWSGSLGGSGRPSGRDVLIGGWFMGFPVGAGWTAGGGANYEVSFFFESDCKDARHIRV